MKKFTAIIMTLVVILSLCACTSASTEEQPLKEHNPEAIFIRIGDTMTFEGQKVSTRAFGGGYLGDFYVNRMTGEIVVIEEHHDYSMALSTGLYWKEDTLEVNGYIIPILHLQDAE